MSFGPAPNITAGEASLALRRMEWERAADLFQADDVAFTPCSLGGVPAEEVRRRVGRTAPDATILYLHGGGYVAGSPRTHRPVTAALARQGLARVVALDYRLAPEHPHPAALDDAVEAVLALLGGGQEPERVALAGDSAGGGLALATMVALRNRGLAQPGCAWLVSPWTDLTRPAEGGRPCPPDAILSSASLARSAALYAGAHDLDGPLISPAGADLRGLPPTLIQIGAREMLIDDALAVARAAAFANVSLTLEVLPDMGHSYVLSNASERPVEKNIRHAARWIRTRLSRRTMRHTPVTL